MLSYLGTKEIYDLILPATPATPDSLEWEYTWLDSFFKSSILEYKILGLNVQNVIRVTKNMIPFSGQLPEDAARLAEDAGKF